MKEEFLHYLWRLKLVANQNLLGSQNETIEIVYPGLYNQNEGPDFLNAKIRIDNQLWAGHVEIHLKSSDWYAHHHELDTNYDAVILHVVWEYDMPVYGKGNKAIPTLILKNFVSLEVLKKYNELFSKPQAWINCESQIGKVDDFGLKVNGNGFLNLAESVDFSVIRKVSSNLLNIESLLFGQAHLLDKQEEDPYFKELKKRYNYLVAKFKLKQDVTIGLQFFRLRPDNFPTIRIAQLAALYHQKQHLFSAIISCKTIYAVYELFDINISKFWQRHYTFSAPTKTKRHQKLTKKFIDLLIINTIIPVLFVYQKTQGKEDFKQLIKIIQSIKPENNAIIKRYFDLGIQADSAYKSQALLQLKNEYCTKKRCLQCQIGHSLLKSDSVN